MAGPALPVLSMDDLVDGDNGGQAFVEAKHPTAQSPLLHEPRVGLPLRLGNAENIHSLFQRKFEVGLYLFN